jgi:DNA-binding beta-propeller fold protein YncE
MIARPALLLTPVAAALAACDTQALSGMAPPEAVLVIGEPGRGPGQFVYPRACAVGPDDELFVADKTGRIQRFDASGRLIGWWTLPYVSDPTVHRTDAADRPAGYPVGMAFDPAGRLFVADTHYYRVLIYATDGRLLGQFGRHGRGPGEFIYTTSVAFDADGFVYVAEYGGNDRVQKFTSEGAFVAEFGSPGAEPGNFRRPQAMAIDAGGRLWVADACNHRLCVYDGAGRLIRVIGSAGRQPGQFHFPYGLTWDRQGNLLVSEFGNCRITKLSADGRALDTWGRLGREVGELKAPWSAAVDSRNRVYVVDSANNRVVRFTWP